jgi:hypothetical protein
LFVTRSKPNSISLNFPDTSIIPSQANLTAEEIDENIMGNIFIDGSVIEINPVAKYERN